jgi:hypothetical protein
MPRLPIDYENGLDCYIGSTANYTQRKASHASAVRRGVTYPVYTHIRSHGGWANWDMVLVERWPCANKLELEKRERHHIEQLKPTLNRSVPTRTAREHYAEFKESYQARRQAYYAEHAEEVKERNKAWNNAHREEIRARQNKTVECPGCGLPITYANSAVHRRSAKHARLEFARNLYNFIYS